MDGRNPAAAEVGSLSHYLQGFSAIPGGCLGFLPSTVAPENFEGKFYDAIQNEC